jgi:hypothetical protein
MDWDLIAVGWHAHDASSVDQRICLFDIFSGKVGPGFEKNSLN